ncbi:MAG: succinyl-diaminopimelate desuccinylase [Alphaproteobacteria bacterium]|nr:succinyl-diaminopimelate desuccinylase [Alphaproteobacteria bacterium]
MTDGRPSARVRAQIDPKDAVGLAQALIRCPSVTPADGGTLALLSAVLEPMGFACDIVTFSDADTSDVSNLYARLGDASPNFCFAGHLDVVPVGATGEWTKDPFGGEIVDGRLFGRGAADMKSAVAAFVAACASFLDANGPPSGSISFLITGDEEGPAINGTKKLLEWVSARGETLDVCLVGEPTSPERLGDMIKIGRRGSINCRLTVEGIQGHTAYPHLADNPIHKLIAILAALTGTPLDGGSEHFEASTLQVTSVDVGNEATNVTPASASAAFNIRFGDLHSSDSLKRWIAERIGEAVGESCVYRLGIHVTGESFLTPPGPLSDLIAGAVGEVTGETPILGTTGGTSDARFIKDYCPVAEFGLVGRTMHKVDESSSVDDIEKLTEIYRLILERYFSARRT